MPVSSGSSDQISPDDSASRQIVKEPDGKNPLPGPLILRAEHELYYRQGLLSG